jgi:hypothetical protein
MKPLYLLPIVLTILSCEGLPSEPDGLRALADKMETQQNTYDKAYDNWGSGDVASTFTAYLNGNAVAFIEEHMTRGTSGRSINRYYFYDDLLFCYRESRNNSDTTHVEVEIIFDANGEVLAAKQKKDNQPIAVDSYSAPMAKKHGQTLRELAKDAPHMQ